MSTTIKKKVYKPGTTIPKALEEIDAQIGDLEKLQTKAKGSLVDAINEAATTGGGSGSGEELTTSIINDLWDAAV